MRTFLVFLALMGFASPSFADSHRYIHLEQYVSSAVQYSGEFPSHHTVNTVIPSVEAKLEMVLEYATKPEGSDLDTELSTEDAVFFGEFLESILQHYKGWQDVVEQNHDPEMQGIPFRRTFLDWTQKDIDFRRHLIHISRQHFKNGTTHPRFLFSFLNRFLRDLVTPARFDVNAHTEAMRGQLNKWVLLVGDIFDQIRQQPHLRDYDLGYDRTLESFLLDQLNRYVSSTLDPHIYRPEIVQLMMEKGIGRNSLKFYLIANQWLYEFQGVNAGTDVQRQIDDHFEPGVKEAFNELVIAFEPMNSEAFLKAEVEEGSEFLQWLQLLIEEDSAERKARITELEGSVQSRRAPGSPEHFLFQEMLNVQFRWDNSSPSMVKGYHQSIEALRAGLYRIMTAQLPVPNPPPTIFEAVAEDFINNPYRVLEVISSNVKEMGNHPHYSRVLAKVLFHSVILLDANNALDETQQRQFERLIFDWLRYAPNNFYLAGTAYYILRQVHWPAATRLEAFRYLQNSPLAQDVFLQDPDSGFHKLLTRSGLNPRSLSFDEDLAQELRQRVQEEAGEWVVRQNSYSPGFEVQRADGEFAYIEGWMARALIDATDSGSGAGSLCAELLDP